MIWKIKAYNFNLQISNMKIRFELNPGVATGDYFFYYVEYQFFGIILFNLENSEKVTTIISVSKKW